MTEKKETWVRVCPRCKSTEVTCRGAITKEMVSPNWVCLTCGFQSPVFPEVSVDDAKKLPGQSANFVVSRLPITSEPFSKPVSAILLGVLFVIFILLLLDIIGIF